MSHVCFNTLGEHSARVVQRRSRAHGGPPRLVCELILSTLLIGARDSGGGIETANLDAVNPTVILLAKIGAITYQPTPSASCSSPQ